jgi:hypothetical protein
MSTDHSSLHSRAALDRLFAMDALLSMVFGAATIVAPHQLVSAAAGGDYNHGVHETLRYDCVLYVFVGIFQNCCVLILSSSVCFRFILYQIVCLFALGMWLDTVAHSQS